MLPDFSTERLFLRPRTIADLGACLAMDRDPEVTRFVAGPWADPKAHEAFVRARMLRDWGAGLGYWSIAARAAPDRFLGWILLLPLDGEEPGIEIGWRLARAAWGHGYASEAACPIVAHAFNTLLLSRIIAEINPGNAGSIRVAEKIGMQRDAVVPAEAGYISFVMTRDDFHSTRA
ncbi:GNAT family N-acetyltransferase [Stappia sp. MMSF_3263]|uniref:GNAT family N-acetyltransferase n=1 Tax=Stappia sp. MMSF_3263 TaxID=3046693 RepID=UPI00273EB8C0|nr:GNAT family N-acetyltransferase [Stappia sp. MMSF_3263]